MLAGSVSSRGIARWDGGAWNALGGGVARGTVQAIAVMGSTVFVAGNFDSVDGGRLGASGIAAWVDFRWKVVSGGIVGAVHSLAVVAPCVVAGGSFRIAGNSSSLGLARLCGGNEGIWEAIAHMPSSSSEMNFCVFRFLISHNVSPDAGTSVKFVVATLDTSYTSGNCTS